MSVDQSTFKAAILNPDAAHPLGLSDGTDRPAGRRFDVYRNNVAVSLGDALESTFPIIRKLLGTDNFSLLAAAFLRTHPPSSPLMMFYGNEMPNFLSSFEPTASTGYLPDVSRLELAIRESYHAADAGPINPEDLQSLPPDQLMQSRLTLAPSLRLIRSPWPVHSIWRFNTEANAPKPEMQAEDIAILRAELDPLPYLLAPGGAAFIESIQSGARFGEAAEAGSSEPEFDLTAVLTLLIGTNAITHIGD